MSIKYINGVPGAPAALGPYSQATIESNTVYLSGQIGFDPDTSELVSDSVEEQCDQVMKNILAVLGFMGLDFTHVMKATILLTDINDFHLINTIYSKWLCGSRPARSTYQVAALPLGAKVEIEMIAHLELDGGEMLAEGSIKDLQKIKEASVDCQSN